MKTIAGVRSLAKKSRAIIWLYERCRRSYLQWVFLRAIPRKEWRNVRKLALILRTRRYTMLSYPRLSVLYEIAADVTRKGVAGTFVECGVWHGGSAAILGTRASKDQDRHLWLFDSWEGLPQPSKFDVAVTGRPGEKGMAHGSEPIARNLLFRKLSLDERRIHLIKGWFE